VEKTQVLGDASRIIETRAPAWAHTQVKGVIGTAPARMAVARTLERQFRVVAQFEIRDATMRERAIWGAVR
jgi:hypothetical protein